MLTLLSMNANSFFLRVKPSSRTSSVAPLLLAGVALLVGPELSACDGSAPGVILGSDTQEFAFATAQPNASGDFRLTISAAGVETLTAASVGFAVDVVAGGPAIEVSVTPPGGTASTDSTPESITSSGVTYDRYVVTLGDASVLCPETGACSLDYEVLITRTGVTVEAFDATATVSAVITGDTLNSDDVALDFL